MWLGGASQGFSAPAAAGPPPRLTPSLGRSGSCFPEAPPESWLVKDGQQPNLEAAQHPSRVEQTKRGPHTKEYYSASKRKEVPTHLTQHGRSLPITLSLKEARHKRAEAIRFRFREAPQWALSERQKVGGGGQGSGKGRERSCLMRTEFQREKTEEPWG